MQKPVVGTETDTVNTPTVETGTVKDTINVPTVKTEKKEVTLARRSRSRSRRSRFALPKSRDILRTPAGSIPSRGALLSHAPESA